MPYIDTTLVPQHPPATADMLALATPIPNVDAETVQEALEQIAIAEGVAPPAAEDVAVEAIEGLVGEDVQGALESLAGRAVFSGDAADVVVAAIEGLEATDAQGALAEILDKIPSAAGDVSVAAIVGEAGTTAQAVFADLVGRLVVAEAAITSLAARVTALEG